VQPTPMRPEFEGKPKTSQRRMVEGCLLLFLFTTLIGVGIAILFSMWSKIFG